MGLTLIQDKCNFCKKQLKFLGHVVTSAGLVVDSDEVDALLKIPTPLTCLEVSIVIKTFFLNFSTLAIE